jgi:hypothetical protein
MSKGIVELAVEVAGDEGWITGSEARRILGWENTASVRNRAKAGGFRWRKKGNGNLIYHRRDVEEYAARALSAEAVPA